MKASDKAYNLIKRWEGCSLKSYNCHAGVCTVGYGNTSDARPNQVISYKQALELLHKDVTNVENQLNNLIKVSLNQNQFDALVSFVFNIGGGAFELSTCLKRINSKEFKKVPDEIMRWKYSKGKVLAGLEKRRAEEVELWNTKERVRFVERILRLFL